MRLRLAILGASVAFAAGLSATAASAVGYRPRAAYAVAPIMSWTGFYIGGHVGVAWSDVEWSNVAFSNVTFTGERFDNSASGFIGGRQLGHKQQSREIGRGVAGPLSGSHLSKRFHQHLHPH